MKNLLLPNKITGLNAHMRIYAGGETRTTFEIEDGDIIIGSKEWNAYVKTSVVEPPSILSEPQKKALQTILNLEEKSKIIPLKQILPPNEFGSALLNYCSKIGVYLKENPPHYYDFYLKRQIEFLENLHPAFIDEDKFLSYSIEDQQGLVKTFTPGKDGYAKKVVYDHFKTPTGRLVVSDGPNVLTINKKYRDMVTSSYGEEGVILSVDYISLEPSVLLASSSEGWSNWLSSTRRYCKPDELDIYQITADVLLGKGFVHTPLTRDEAKAIVLRTLYGAQEELIGQIVQGKNSIPLYDFLFEVRELFNVNALFKNLQSERKENGGVSITNYFCRKIPTSGVEDYKLVNYYVQSTAVDVALLGFAKIAKAAQGKKIKPLFVVHDALFLDVHKSAIPDLKECIAAGKANPVFPSGSFSLKATVLR